MTDVDVWFQYLEKGLPSIKGITTVWSYFVLSSPKNGDSKTQVLDPPATTFYLVTTLGVNTSSYENDLATAPQQHTDNTISNEPITPDADEMYMDKHMSMI